MSLPDASKSTLFSAITNAGAESVSYLFRTTDPNMGVAAVPDHQLDALTEMYHPRKTTPAVVELVDIAGLIKDTSKGQGLGSKFLANIRECDAIVHVVYCFDDKNVMHVAVDTSTNVPMDPTGDIGIIDIKLVMADVEMVERRIDKAQKAAKGNKKCLYKVEVFSALRDWLNDGNPARSLDCDEDDAAIIAIAELLSLKPIIYTVSLDKEGSADCHANAYYKVVEELAAKEGAQVVSACAKLEAEIAESDNEERKMFPDGLGIVESGLDRLIKVSYVLPGLISFLASGEDECRVWMIKQGTKTPQVAGKIHTDFERSFIRVKVISLDDLTACGSTSAAKEEGLVCSEGKEYVMKGDDIVLFRFNV